MSLDFKLAMPAATGNMPVPAKGSAQKSLANAGQFGAMLAGGKQEAEPPSTDRNGIARPETDWKAQKNIWAVRELKGDNQPEETDDPTAGEDEIEQEPTAATPPPVFTVPTHAAGADTAEQGTAHATVEPASDQPRGRRTVETSSKDDPKAAHREAAATVLTAATNGQAGQAAPASGDAAAVVQASAPSEDPQAGAGDGKAARPMAERQVEAGATLRDTGPRDRAEPKVTVVSSQVSVAPAAPAPAASLSPTGSAFVASLTSDSVLPQYVSETAGTMGGQETARPVTTLKIQLHPAELGTVTVKLAGAGEQLSVEVHVETVEARHRLTSDSDAIVQALRGMGYDIDRITVQQAPSTAGSNGGGTNRENAFTPQDGRSGERQDQPARQGTDRRHEQEARSGMVAGGDRGEAGGGGGVYI